MAIGDDFTVAVNGDIRHASGTTTYTVLQLHRWLQDLADDAQAAGNDLIDITSDTPSERSTDNIITLNAPYNIDDDAAEYLYAGSITQSNGDTVYSGLQVLGAVNASTTQLYVIQNNKLYPFTTTDNAPFWGDQSNTVTGDLGYNGDSASGVLMRCMIKTRDNGADIDGKRIRVQARHWGDSYDFFNVTLGQGESVAAIGTTPDAQNDTPLGTVTDYSHVVNSGGTANAPTGGYQTIDLNNGNGALEYYSAWTYGADTSGDGLKGVWEYIKELSGHGSAPIDAQDETSYDNTGNNGTFVGGDGAGGTAYSVSDTITLSDSSTGDTTEGTQITVDAVDGNGDVTQFTVSHVNSDSSLKPGDTLTQASTSGTGTAFTLTLGSNNLIAQKTIDTLDGQLFLGITHSMPTGVPSSAFTERDTIAWGTSFAYDGGTTMNTPAANDRVVFSGGSGGQITYTDAGAATGNLYVMLDSGDAAPANDETFICYNDAGTNIGDAVVNGSTTGTGGGTGLLLADDTTDDDFYIQLLTGTAPGNSQVLIDPSGDTATTSSAATAQTIPKTYLGSYTGSLIGAYGVGLDADDLSASDTITPLVGATQTPPNNQSFTVTGLVWDSGVDGESDRVLVGPRAASILQKNQFAVTNGPLVSGSTTVDIGQAIPTDTPTAGDIRVENDSGVYLETPYTSYTGNVFTLTGTYGDDAANTNNVFIGYIDNNVQVNTTTLSFTAVYSTDRDLFVRVRDGGTTPIKTFEAPATFGSSGGSIAAIRTTDL